MVINISYFDQRGQFQGQNIGQKDITRKVTQIKYRQIGIPGFLPLSKILYCSRLDH